MPIDARTVEAYNSSGNFVSRGFTRPDGTYTIGGLPPGAYFVRTWSSDADPGLWRLCCETTCDVTTGTPVAVTLGSTTPNIDLEIVPKGKISGRVTDIAGVPISGLVVEGYDSLGNGGSIGTTQNDGTYSSSGLPSGTYFLKTRNGNKYVNQLYHGISCPSVCDVTSGTPVAVSLATATPNIDFALTPKGRITGKVTGEDGAPLDISYYGIGIALYDASGHEITNLFSSIFYHGVYASDDLVPGTYYAVARASRPYVNKVYGGSSCTTSCSVVSGTPIVVTPGSTISNVDFSLVTGGSISGTVRLPDGSPLIHANVRVFRRVRQLHSLARKVARSMDTRC